nr:ABC transporter permease [Chlorobium phaeovibrioides]
MKEWSSFVGFVVKEFYHIFRDRRTAAILFGMPVIQLLLFGYAIRNEIQEVKIGIADLSRDAVSQAITDKLLSSGTFVLVKNPQSHSEIQSAFRSGAMSEAVIFEPASDREIQREGSMDIQVITDGSDPNVSRIITGYTAR